MLDCLPLQMVEKISKSALCNTCPMKCLPSEMQSLFHKGGAYFIEAWPKNGNQRRQIILNSSLFYLHWPQNTHEPQRCAYLVYPARSPANKCLLREVFWRSPFELPFIFSSYHFKDSISLVMPVTAACWILEIFPMVWSSLSVFHISNGIRMVTRLSCMVLPPSKIKLIHYNTITPKCQNVKKVQGSRFRVHCLGFSVASGHRSCQFDQKSDAGLAESHTRGSRFKGLRKKTR